MIFGRKILNSGKSRFLQPLKKTQKHSSFGPKDPTKPSRKLWGSCLPTGIQKGENKKEEKGPCSDPEKKKKSAIIGGRKKKKTLALV